jgi:hypothetical protein
MDSQTHEELIQVTQRIQLALGRRPLLPFQSLQYRLAEVGQSRAHPIQLRAALRLLGARSARRSRAAVRNHPWEPLRDLFASSELSWRAAQSLAKSRADTLASLSSLDWDSGMKRIANFLANEVSGLQPLERGTLPPHPVVLAANHVFNGFSEVFVAEGSARPVHVWLTEEAGWLGPNDPRLWAFLNSCRMNQARALVVARYIDPASFVLFKVLGVRGLQYYNVWAPDRLAARTAEDAEELGWFKVKPASAAKSHPLFGKIASAIEYLVKTEASSEANAAVDLAVRLGLSESMHAQTHALRTWAEQSPCPMPDRWIGTIRKWETWEQLDSTLTLPSELLAEKQTMRSNLKAAEQRLKTSPLGEAVSSRSRKENPTVSRVPIRLR